MARYLKFLDGKLQCIDKNDCARNKKYGVVPQQEIYSFIGVPLFTFSAPWVT